MCDQSSTSEYLKEIRKYPLLSFEEEIELSKKIQAGDLAAHKKLIESNLRLVVSVARRYTTHDMPLLDNIQEGNLGLITAAQKYSFSFKVRFSTYACWWIQQSITRAIANKRRMIRLPFRKEELSARIRRASAELFQSFSRMPTNQEIAEYLDMTVTEVCDILRYSGAIASLDVCFDDEESPSLKDLIPDSNYNPEEEFMKKYTQTCIVDMLSDLEQNEKQVMLKRYNLENDEKCLTLKKIGSMYGVSAETVRQVEMRAIRKLKSRSEEIRELVYG